MFRVVTNIRVKIRRNRQKNS